MTTPAAESPEGTRPAAPIRMLGVCGFGRCGTTMLMTMLHAGGMRPVSGTLPGSYEGRRPFGLTLDTLTRDDVDGRAVKLLDQVVTGYSIPTHLEQVPIAWRFVWLDRQPMEQARSQVKLLNQAAGAGLPHSAVFKFASAYRTDRPAVIAAYEALGPVDVLSYEEVLADPLQAATTLRGAIQALGLDSDAGHPAAFDVRAAAGVVHTRKPGCRPDLAVEQLLTASPTATRRRFQ